MSSHVVFIVIRLESIFLDCPNIGNVKKLILFPIDFLECKTTHPLVNRSFQCSLGCQRQLLFSSKCSDQNNFKQVNDFWKIFIIFQVFVVFGVHSDSQITCDRTK